MASFEIGRFDKMNMDEHCAVLLCWVDTNCFRSCVHLFTCRPKRRASEKKSCQLSFVLWAVLPSLQRGHGFFSLKRYFVLHGCCVGGTYFTTRPRFASSLSLRANERVQGTLFSPHPGVVFCFFC